jgi:hypothetical protein
VGANSCYVDLYGENCPNQMFGDNAPGATWEETFNHADLGPNVPFPGAPGSFFSLGDGFGAPTSDCNPPNNGGPNPTPSPNPSCSSGTGTKRKPPAVPPTPTPSP